MRIAMLVVIATLLATACTGSDEPPATTNGGVKPATVADTVYTNGRIYTVNGAQPWAEAVAIKDGKFIVVGSAADIEVVTSDGTTVVDLGGRMAMPGLIDTHNHATGASMGKAIAKN